MCLNYTYILYNYMTLVNYIYIYLYISHIIEWYLILSLSIYNKIVIVSKDIFLHML